MRRRGSCIAVAAVMSGSALVACETPAHKDTLVFGTNTKFAIDIAPAPEVGGVPSLTVGYKRQEFVVMPLLVNGNDTQFCKTDPAATPPKTCGVSEVDKAKYVGTDSGKQDAYSVFASFGAKFSGEGGSGGSKAEGGLAQFFATGVAAQKLAGNQNVEAALSVKSSDAEMAAAQARANSALLTPENRDVALIAYADALKTAPSQLETVVAKAKTSGSFTATDWGKIVDATEGIDDSLKSQWKGFDEAAVRKNFSSGGDYFEFLSNLFAAASK